MAPWYDATEFYLLYLRPILKLVLFTATKMWPLYFPPPRQFCCDGSVSLWELFEQAGEGMSADSQGALKQNLVVPADCEPHVLGDLRIWNPPAGWPPLSPSEVMRGQIIKVSVSLAVLMTSTASLFAISWIGLALLGF
jgi:hypothetical protein